MPLNRPTRDELLQALAEYLRNPPDDSRMDAFLRRIAANVTDICLRELALGDQYQAADQAWVHRQVKALEAGSLEGLCRLLATGAEDRWLRAQLPAWLALAQAKLDIDNPGYPR